MASTMFILVGLVALFSSQCNAGVATYSYTPYSYSPYTTYQLPAAAPAVTYNSHVPLYQQSIVAPAYVKSASYSAPAPVAVKSQYVKTYAAPVAPLATQAVVPAPAPVVKSLAVPVSAPVLRQVEIESEPRYDFSYGVHDSITGDIKNQVETRAGGNVAGSYSLVDADGYKRTVTYTADDLNGFNAVVQREPLVAKLAAVAAAPILPAVAPVQQTLQYLPQLPVATPPQHLAESEVVEAPQQPIIAEPAPVEYPEQVAAPAPVPAAEYPPSQQFPPYPQFEIPAAAPAGTPAQAEGDDSDVVEVRTVKENNNTAAKPIDNETAAPKNAKEAKDSKTL